MLSLFPTNRMHTLIPNKKENSIIASTLTTTTTATTTTTTAASAAAAAAADAAAASSYYCYCCRYQYCITLPALKQLLASGPSLLVHVERLLLEVRVPDKLVHV